MSEKSKLIVGLSIGALAGAVTGYIFGTHKDEIKQGVSCTENRLKGHMEKAVHDVKEEMENKTAEYLRKFDQIINEMIAIIEEHKKQMDENLPSNTNP